MWMTVQKFPGDGVCNCAKIEFSIFFRYARVEYDLEKQISQLITDLVRFALLDCINDLVHFFQGVAGK